MKTKEDTDFVNYFLKTMSPKRDPAYCTEINY